MKNESFFFISSTCSNDEILTAFTMLSNTARHLLERIKEDFLVLESIYYLRKCYQATIRRGRKKSRKTFEPPSSGKLFKVKCDFVTASLFRLSATLIGLYFCRRLNSISNDSLGLYVVSLEPRETENTK